MIVMPKVYKTKKGQPYIILKSGRARFIKKSSSARSVKRSRPAKTFKYKTRHRYTMPKKKSYRRGKSKSDTTMRELMGMAGYAIAEPYIDKIAGQVGIGVPTNLLEAGLGYFLKGKGGIVGSVGKVMWYVNATQAIADLMKGINLPFLQNSTNNNATPNDGW